MPEPYHLGDNNYLVNDPENGHFIGIDSRLVGLRIIRLPLPENFLINDEKSDRPKSLHRHIVGNGQHYQSKSFTLQGKTRILSKGYYITHNNSAGDVNER